MKNFFTTLFFLVCLSTLLLLPVTQTTYSQEEGGTQTTYQLLEPLPGTFDVDSEGKKVTTASQYITGIFMLIIGLAGALAVVMIIIGGIQYMSTDAMSGKSEAKNTISNALWGLALAMSAWIILNTIDERLVQFDLRLDPITINPTSGVGAGGGGGGGGGRDGGPSSTGRLAGYVLTPAQIEANNQTRQKLLNHNPTIETKDPCSSGGTVGCVNLVGLPENAIAGVESLAKSCNCSVFITGGTEGGHITHGPNKAIVDIRRNYSKTLDDYIEEGQKIEPRTRECSMLGAQYRLNGAIYVNEGSHWHVCY